MTFPLRSAAFAVAAAAFGALPAHAATITVFTQDFSGGLGANEFITGGFAVGGGQMGHVNGDYAANERSIYEVSLDLTNLTSAFMTFDWLMNTEKDFDGWNLRATTGEFIPFLPARDAVSPIYTHDHGWGRGVSGVHGGRSTFDLSDFAGQVVKVQLAFYADYLAQGPGVQFDNVSVYGDASVAGAVPEPATWAMMILGFGAAGAMLRRRAALTVA